MFGAACLTGKHGQWLTTWLEQPGNCPWCEVIRLQWQVGDYREALRENLDTAKKALD